jgi:hypothetical protein
LLQTLDPNVANTPNSCGLSMAEKEHGTLRKSSTHPTVPGFRSACCAKSWCPRNEILFYEIGKSMARKETFI